MNSLLLLLADFSGRKNKLERGWRRIRKWKTAAVKGQFWGRKKRRCTFKKVPQYIRKICNLWRSELGNGFSLLVFHLPMFIKCDAFNFGPCQSVSFYAFLDVMYLSFLLPLLWNKSLGCVRIKDSVREKEKEKIQDQTVQI